MITATDRKCANMSRQIQYEDAYAHPRRWAKVMLNHYVKHESLSEVLRCSMRIEGVAEFLCAYAPAFDVVHDGSEPTTLEELTSVFGHNEVLKVSGRHCEQTIFGSQELNCAFRAWHDWMHYSCGLDTSCVGESALALKHIEAIRCADLGVDGVNWRFVEAVIWVETYGQNAFYREHGRFPSNQSAFSLSALANGIGYAVKWAEAS